LDSDEEDGRRSRPQRGAISSAGLPLACDQVGDLRRRAAAMEAVRLLLKAAVGLGDALVLAQMIEPIVQHERLDPPARVLGVGE
jgi:hypothetical protein